VNLVARQAQHEHEDEKLVSYDEAVGGGLSLEEGKPLYQAQGIEVEQASE
jgi:hypothetical protein